MRRLFFDTQHLALFIEIDDTVTLRVTHVIAENCRAGLALTGSVQHFNQTLAVENIIAQHQRDIVFTDKIGADGKRLRQAFGFRLFGITEVHAPLLTTTQEV